MASKPTSPSTISLNSFRLAKIYFVGGRVLASVIFCHNLFFLHGDTGRRLDQHIIHGGTETFYQCSLA